MNKIKQLIGGYVKTDFGAGGLTARSVPQTFRNTYKKDDKFVAPRKLDFRDMCIKTSDQSSTPHCAGYATAGMIEMRNWKEKHYPEQLDGGAIYKAAKVYDGPNSGDGTSLESAIQGAMDLGLTQGLMQFIAATPDDMKYCIHTHQSFVAGFMITDEWNMVSGKTGRIADYGAKADWMGGHAVLVCGYDDEGLYIQNSWGSFWGRYGFALIPWPQVFKQYVYGAVII